MGQCSCCAGQPPDPAETSLKRCCSAGEEDEAPGPAGEPPRRRLSSSWSDSLWDQFPMHTVPMDAFLAMEEMQPFEALVTRKAVRPVDPDAVVHFISHEWLGFQHPDPEGVQLGRMQQIFRSVIEGKTMDLFSPADWTAFAQRVSVDSRGAYRRLEGALNREMAGGALTEELFREHVLFGEVWLDFASVPQASVERDESKIAAIRSIPAYLDSSQYFWVLAPPARHVDKGTWCSFATWRSRGWCRLEEWGNFLKAQPCAPLIVTHSEKLTTVGFVDFMLACQGKPYLAPCAGAFTCCREDHKFGSPQGEKRVVPCDKSFVAPVLWKFFEEKRAQMRASPSGNFWHAMFIGKVAPMLFGGAPKHLIEQGVDPEDLEAESVEAFLDRFGFSSVGEIPAPGFSVWCYAAMVGHVPMLRRLQAQPEAMARLGEEVHDMNLSQSAAEQGHVEALRFLLDHALVPASSLNTRSPGLGITALDRAAKGGCPTMVTFLLERRADLASARRSDGSTPLHGAAMSGHAACCQVLLQRRADVGGLDSAGRAAIHLAADPVTLYGNAEGKLPTLKALLEFRADPLLKDAAGKSALGIAREASFKEAESILSA